MVSPSNPLHKAADILPSWGVSPRMTLEMILAGVGWNWIIG